VVNCRNRTSSWSSPTLGLPDTFSRTARSHHRSDKNDADGSRRIEREGRICQLAGWTIDLEQDRDAVVLPLGEDVVARRVDLEVSRRPADGGRGLERERTARALR